MASKMISSGTLNLRFMQNAQRAKDNVDAAVSTGETSSSQAVQDESRWEVSAEVKKAWGISSQTSVSQPGGVVHEASYLPFLLSSAETSTSGVKLRGRRTWNKKGEEIVADEAHQPEETGSSTPTATTSLKRLTSISGSGTQYAPQPKKGVRASVTDAKRSKARTGANGKTAMQAIREDVVIGTDLRPVPPARPPPSSPPKKEVFMKPAGIDDPATTGKDVVGGARTKRERDHVSQDLGTEEKKQKKKKKVAKAEE